MEISILAEFVKLVETCNFQETADQMSISQSTLTKHIHKMEEELNVVLFDRSSRAIQVNEYSRKFYPYAKQILHTYGEAMGSIKEMQEVDKSSITVSYNPILGQYGVVEILSSFSLQYPQHNLVPLESYNSMELLSNKSCNFAFVSEAEAEGSVFSKMIFKTDYLAVVMPKDHPLAGNKTVTLSQMENESFVLHSSNVSTAHDETSKFLELCRQQNFTPKIITESLFSSTMIHYVRNGKGLAVLNRMRIPELASDVAVVDISPTVRTYLYLLYPRHITTSCAKDFLHYMVEYCNR